MICNPRSYSTTRDATTCYYAISRGLMGCGPKLSPGEPALGGWLMSKRRGGFAHKYWLSTAALPLRQRRVAASGRSPRPEASILAPSRKRSQAPCRRDKVLFTRQRSPRPACQRRIVRHLRRICRDDYVQPFNLIYPDHGRCWSPNPTTKNARTSSGHAPNVDRRPTPQPRLRLEACECRIERQHPVSERAEWIHLRIHRQECNRRQRSTTSRKCRPSPSAFKVV
jgi:hypothetical protein